MTKLYTLTAYFYNIDRLEEVFKQTAGFTFKRKNSKKGNIKYKLVFTSKDKLNEVFSYYTNVVKIINMNKPIIQKEEYTEVISPNPKFYTVCILKDSEHGDNYSEFDRILTQIDSYKYDILGSNEMSMTLTIYANSKKDLTNLIDSLSKEITPVTKLFSLIYEII